MKDPQDESTQRVKTPLAALGGFVATLKPEEAIEIKVGEGILIAVYRAPNSQANCRIRILAHGRIPIRRVREDEVATIVRAVQALRGEASQ